MELVGLEPNNVMQALVRGVRGARAQECGVRLAW